MISYLFCTNVEILKCRIKPVQDSHDRFVILKHEKLQAKQIKHRNSKQDSPNSRMRTGKWTIWESQNRDDQEEKYDTQKASPDVLLIVGFISVQQMQKDTPIKICCQISGELAKVNLQGWLVDASSMPNQPNA